MICCIFSLSSLVLTARLTSRAEHTPVMGCCHCFKTCETCLRVAASMKKKIKYLLVRVYRDEQSFDGLVELHVHILGDDVSQVQVRHNSGSVLDTWHLLAFHEGVEHHHVKEDQGPCYSSRLKVEEGDVQLSARLLLLHQLARTHCEEGHEDVATVSAAAEQEGQVIFG